MSLWNQNFIPSTATIANDNNAYSDQTATNQNLKRRISDLVQGYGWSPEYFPNLQQRTGLNGINSIPPQVSSPFGNTIGLKEEPPTYAFPSANPLDVKPEPPSYDYSGMGQGETISGTSNNPNDAIPKLSTSALSAQLGNSTNFAKSSNMKRLMNSKPRKHVSSHNSGNTAPNRRPAFILKLWNMVNDPKNHEYIKWSDDGESFTIKCKDNFEKLVLPRYFRHSNYSSFVRQLNMYGWHKIQDITSGSIQSGDEVRQFKSPYFIRGREDLLDNIVRNKGSKGSDDEDGGHNADLSKILDELDLIKSNQMEIAADLNRIRSDNQMLWRECYESRERHKAHADKFERILRLLASVFSSTQGPNKLVGDGSTANNLISSMLGAAENNEITSHNRINDDVPAALGANKPRLLLSNGPIDGKFSELSNAGKDKSSQYNNHGRISTVPEPHGAHVSEISTPVEADTPAIATPATVVTPAAVMTSAAVATPTAVVTPAAVATPAATAGMKSASKNPDSAALFDPVATADFHVDPLKPAAGDTDVLDHFPPLSPSSIYSTNPTTHNVVGGEPKPEDFELINPLIDAPAVTTSSLPVESIPAVTPGSAASPQPWLNSDVNPNTELLSANDNNLEDLIRNIDFQGDSLQRIQDRLAKYLPSDNLDVYQTPFPSTTNATNTAPSTTVKQEVDTQDPSFDVDDFILNANPDDLGENDYEGPVKKKAKY